MLAEGSVASAGAIESTPCDGWDVSGARNSAPSAAVAASSMSSKSQVSTSGLKSISSLISELSTPTSTDEGSAECNDGCDDATGVNLNRRGHCEFTWFCVWCEALSTLSFHGGGERLGWRHQPTYCTADNHSKAGTHKYQNSTCSVRLFLSWAMMYRVIQGLLPCGHVLNM